MENVESLLIWLSLLMAVFLVGLCAVQHRKARSAESLIQAILCLGMAVSLAALLAMRYLK